MYARKFLKDENVFWCSLLPILVFKPMLSSQIDKVFNEIIKSCDVSKNLLQQWCSPSDTSKASLNASFRAKLRVIQYIVSHKLAEFWFETITPNDTDRYLDRHNIETLHYLFPDPIIPIIENLSMKNISDILRNIECLEEADLVYSNAPEQLDKKYKKDAWSIENRLSSLFLNLYHDFELPARSLVKKHGAAVFNETGPEWQEYQKYIYRLDKGYSFLDLVNCLSDLDTSTRIKKKIVSRFLDAMIDKGVVVPITCIYDDKVYRGFRHGEDVNFADGERYALHRLLNDYISELESSDTISGIEIEKLSVIAIKTLLRKKYFNQPNKNILVPCNSYNFG